MLSLQLCKFIDLKGLLLAKHILVLTLVNDTSGSPFLLHHLVSLANSIHKGCFAKIHEV